MNGKAIETLDFIKTFFRENGYSPTYREIGQAIHINSTSYVNRLLFQLEDAHLITRKPGVTRSIVLICPEE